MAYNRILRGRRITVSEGGTVVCPTCSCVQEGLWLGPGAMGVDTCRHGCAPRVEADPRAGRLLYRMFGRTAAVVALKPDDLERFPLERPGRWELLYEEVGLPGSHADIREFYEALPRGRRVQKAGNLGT